LAGSWYGAFSLLQNGCRWGGNGQKLFQAYRRSQYVDAIEGILAASF
jgi:hypothetical protein